MPTGGGAPGREQWRSRSSFVLATIGAAVGLGNIWRFSYVAGENGGATFLIVYLVCVVLVGAPIVIAELAVGRHTQGDAVASFQSITRQPIWAAPGLLGVLGSFLVMCFYFVVAGWALKYFVGSVTGSLWRRAGNEYGGYFDAFIASPFEPVIWQFGAMCLAVMVVTVGVQRGIERVTRVLMPLLALIVIGLAVFSITQEGSTRGLRFLFTPNWALLQQPDIYLAALGQAFFSLSVGMAVFLTYGSYLAKDHKIPGAAAAVIAGDTLIAIAAGIAIFPAVFAYGLDPDTGPRLVFITLPQLFLAMPAGTFVGVLFFFLLAGAALSASVSGIEVPVAYIRRRFNISRRRAAMLTGLATFVLGVPASLGYGIWRDIRWDDRGILESMDYVVSNGVLPLGGLLVALFVGWRWGARSALRESDLGSGTIGHIWLWLLRVVVPAIIALVFLRGVGAI